MVSSSCALKGACDSTWTLCPKSWPLSHSWPLCQATTLSLGTNYGLRQPKASAVTPPEDGGFWAGMVLRSPSTCAGPLMGVFCVQEARIWWFVKGRGEYGGREGGAGRVSEAEDMPT